MKDLVLLFEEYIQNEQLFSRSNQLLLAVSGGVDSVVLCELFYLAGYSFSIAHCNFQLRGEESNRDEEFVGSLAQRYGARLYSKRFETQSYVLQNKVSVQVAARALRYQWFNELALQIGTASGLPVNIVTAHHGDDNIETVLMNFFKGTGITGMRGMLPKNGNIIRPLLFTGKQEIIAFAKMRTLDFVEDSSNTSDKYSRNYLRHQVVPAIQKRYPSVRDNMLNNISRFREVELLYTQAVETHKKNLLEVKDGDIYIPILKLLKVVPLETILYEIIKSYDFTVKQTKEVLALLYTGTGKYVQSPSHRVLRHRNWLIISALRPDNEQMILIDNDQSGISFEGGRLLITKKVIRETLPVLSASPDIAYLDAKEIVFPLILRKWKAGDYFYPLGMQKKKKLSRFFIDQKVSQTEKEKVWVIEMNKKIVWVVNHRIDDRFKVKEGSKVILKFVLEAAKI